MTAKKASPKKKTETPLTKAEMKTEMVNYIGPIFEELKSDIRALGGRMDNYDQKLQSLPRQIVHEMKILLERDERLNSLSDVSKAGEMNTEKIENLDGRVSHLEEDVQVLKVKNP